MELFQIPIWIFEKFDMSGKCNYLDYYIFRGNNKLFVQGNISILGFNSKIKEWEKKYIYIYIKIIYYVYIK